jgi:N-acetylmuramoyl-L-alanine amidase
MKWISIFDNTVTQSRSSIVRTGRVTPVMLCLLALGLPGAVPSAQVPTAKDLYQTAQAAELEARGTLDRSVAESPDAALGLVRTAIRAYRAVVLRYPTSGYCDDALWYGAQLGADAFARFGQDRDRQTAVTLLKLLKSEYPGTPFMDRIKPRLDALGTPAASAAPARPAPAASASPTAPATNRGGGYSMARQLGLGVGRVVIDPGHGGSDPGALGADISEAAITLDIALKLEALLAQTPGLEVVLTRRSDVNVALPERTAIANRGGADLFVSIHVNANRDRSIQGIETFLLSFASTRSAAAVAARENAGSTTTMSQLDGMVRQIALGSKLAESRDLAAQVQAALVARLRAADRGLRDLGVKQAPFVVLIGASMPSVLVEVAFLTNRHESQLLATDTYRQRVAESLADGLSRYVRSLKKTTG